MRFERKKYETKRDEAERSDDTLEDIVRCENCGGSGAISYNPNLNPNSFPGTATAKCTQCGGTGIEDAANKELSGDRLGGAIRVHSDVGRLNKKGKMMKRLFKDHPDGEQLHAGEFRGKPVWHSDDGGSTWWSGWMFSHPSSVTREELVNMAVSIIRDTPNARNQGQLPRKGTDE